MTRAVALLALLIAACGASAVQTNAVIANAAAEALDSGGEAIVSTRHAEEERAIAASSDRATAEHNVEAVRARWAPAVAAHDLAAAAQRAYADAIVAVAAGSKPEAILVALLASLASTWRSTAAALSSLGVTLPALPGGL